jgi:1,3-beta-glucan synthase
MCSSATRLSTKLIIRTSRQIRPPIYSLKQSKLRKRRVVRYAILYFFMFFLFLILIVGPAIVGRFVGDSLFGTSSSLAGSIPLNLLQPATWNNNDTSNKHTGTVTQGGAAGPSSTAGGQSTGGGGNGNPFSSAFGGSKRAVPTAMFVYDMY